MGSQLKKGVGLIELLLAMSLIMVAALGMAQFQNSLASFLLLEIHSSQQPRLSNILAVDKNSSYTTYSFNTPLSQHNAKNTLILLDGRESKVEIHHEVMRYIDSNNDGFDDKWQRVTIDDHEESGRYRYVERKVSFSMLSPQGKSVEVIQASTLTPIYFSD